jgi:hypothetical protein
MNTFLMAAGEPEPLLFSATTPGFEPPPSGLINVEA